MQMQGQALAGSTQSLTTKRGETLQKTKLKVIDLGPEAPAGTCTGWTSWARRRSATRSCAR